MKRGGREGIIFKGVMFSAEQTIQMWAGFQRGVLMEEGCLLRSLCGMRLWAKCRALNPQPREAGVLRVLAIKQNIF
jgi:hypothetical protein